MENEQLSIDDILACGTTTEDTMTNYMTAPNREENQVNNERITDVEYSEVMQQSYINYSMSVITGRAIPDSRDGLKPVQRRILYSIDELGVTADKPYKKSARIVGDTMGKYHPHGDSSIYEAQVIMSQDFKKGIPLVDGHGNYGSVEGDGAAAMRYTEVRLQKFTEDVFFAELPYDTVDFVPNYDETEQEPSVLPCKLPHLLINGSDGIAVGMATGIPPHNLNNVVDAAIYYLDNPKATNEELVSLLIGPDFPTGGIVCNKDELLEIYATGKGKIKIRGKVTFEKGKSREKDKLVITEIPYTMVGDKIGKFLLNVAELVENKTLTDITEITNETNQDGFRIVLELRKNADVEYIKSVLYKKTGLEDTFTVNMLAICDKKPEVLTLQRYLGEFTKFQYEITIRKFQNLLPKVERKREINEGLIKALDVIDLIIEILRGSKNLAQAKKCLTVGITDGIKFRNKNSEKQATKLNFTEVQADAILEMRLSRLIGLELDALQKEYNKILKTIAEYNRILGSKTVMKNLIKKEMLDLKEKYGTDRKTIITNRKAAVFVEKEEAEKDVVILIDRFNYIHTVDMDIYERNQKNETEVEDGHKNAIKISNKDKLLIFTDTGMMHRIKVKDIPYGKYKDKGVPIDNLCNFNSATENIVYLTDSKPDRYLVFISTDSMLKRVPIQEFDTKNKSVQATKLNENHKILCIGEYDEQGYVVLSSDDGFWLKFKQNEIPEKKKNAIGAIGMKMKGGESLETAAVVPADYTDELSVSKRAKRGKRLKK